MTETSAVAAPDSGACTGYRSGTEADGCGPKGQQSSENFSRHGRDSPAAAACRPSCQKHCGQDSPNLTALPCIMLH
jgi:hypothetical protein